MLPQTRPTIGTDYSDCADCEGRTLSIGDFPSLTKTRNTRDARPLHVKIAQWRAAIAGVRSFRQPAFLS
jgi:hypothetical protein